MRHLSSVHVLDYETLTNVNQGDKKVDNTYNDDDETLETENIR